MSQPQDNSDHEIAVRIPPSLSIKDIITIITAAVSISLAWGVFSTRITVIENEIQNIRQAVNAQSTSISELNKVIEQVKDRQTQSDIFIDQLYEVVNKNPPRRRGG